MTARPSAERLDAIARDHLRGLGERARKACASPPIQRALDTARALPEGMRAPMIAWNLAALREPAADLARLFAAGDSLTDEEARAALSQELCDGLLSAGVLSRRDGRVHAEIRLSLGPGHVAILEDRPAFGAVQLARAAVTRKLGRALAFGGDPTAFLLAELADEVVAFDPRPRVAALVRANAGLAGVSLASPERLEEHDRFDLVTVDLRFDDPVERVPLSRAVSSLAPGGMLCAVIETFDRGLLEALSPPDASQVLAVGIPSQTIDEACAQGAATRHPELGETYEHDFDSSLATWTARHVSELTRGALVVVRAEPAWKVPRSLDRDELARFPFRAAFRARVLASHDDATLLAASLSIAAGTRGREVDGGFALRPPFEENATILGGVSAELIDRVHAAPTVREAVEGLASAAGRPVDEAIAMLLPIVREALSTGLLEVASS